MGKIEVSKAARALLVCLQLQWAAANALAQENSGPPAAAPGAPSAPSEPNTPGPNGPTPNPSEKNPYAPSNAPTTAQPPTQTPSAPAQQPSPTPPPNATVPAPPGDKVTDTDTGEEGVDETTIEYNEEAPEESGEPPEAEQPAKAPAAVEAPLEEGADRETGVDGRVVSRKPKKALPDAPVIAKGKDGKVRNTITDAQGFYKLFLPPGSYTLRSYYDLYHGARWDEITVKRGKFSRVNFVLDSISEKEAGIEELEVAYLADTSSESAQLNLRKAAVNVQDAISKQEISRSGDSSAASAARRVVGVSVDDEGRVVVRGLGGRYSKVLVNGVNVPSVDPDIPGVQLDIFPTDIVSNLSVVKTARPDLPADFAGGLVLVETSSFPKNFEFKLGTSLGYNSESTFKDRLDYKGGKIDWLGFDDGTRALPGAVKGKFLDTGSNFPTQADVDDATRQFSDIWNSHRRTAAPAIGLDFSLGNTIKLHGARKVGYLAAFLYDVDQKIRKGFNRDYRFNQNGTTELQSDFDFEKGQLDGQWGTFGSGFYQFNADNVLNVVTLFSRTVNDQTLFQLGSAQGNFGLGTLQSATSLDFIGRTTFFNQVRGDHQNLGNSRVRLQWDAFASTGKRDEPDRRRVTKLVEDDQVIDATRFFSDLNQLGLGGGLNVRVPVWQQAYVTTGARFERLDRDLTNRRFQMYSPDGSFPQGADPEDLFSDMNIGTESRMRDNTSKEDSYTAFSNYFAGFTELETPLGSKFKLLVGARLEDFKQSVQSRSPFNTTLKAKGTDHSDLDVLPSANLTWSLPHQMFLRAGYAMTTARPAVRELAPYVYQDFVRGWSISGNPNLDRTLIHNAELRYEWYFGESNLLAVTGFYKQFVDPIEFVIFSAENHTAGYQNSDHAYLYGGELELRSTLGYLSHALRNFYFGGNISVAKSQTTLKSGQAASGARKHALYNQSSYVTNLSLRFDDPASGVMAGLVYNVAGEKLVEVGPSAGGFVYPSVFEQPIHDLDFVTSYAPNDHLKFKLKWKNMLFQNARLKQGNLIVNREELGTSISVGAEYSY